MSGCNHSANDCDLLSFSSGITEQSAIAQVPGVYPFKLGDFTITVLSDGTLPGSTYAAVEYRQQKPIACFRKTF